MRKSKLHHQRALCRGTCVGVVVALVFALSGQVEVAALAAEQSQRSSNGRPPQRTQGPPTDPRQGVGSPSQGPPTDPGQGVGSPSQGPPSDPGQGVGSPSQGPPSDPGQGVGSPSQGPPTDPGQGTGSPSQPSSRLDVLVGFRNVPGPAEQALVRRAGGQIKHSFRLVSAIASSLPAQALNGLRNNPTVTVIEPDGLVFAQDPELRQRLGREADRGWTGTRHGTVWRGRACRRHRHGHRLHASRSEHLCRWVRLRQRRCRSDG